MKVLVVSTSSPVMRAEIWGWSIEDSDLYVRGKRIGNTPSPCCHLPNTILEALADGWKLLGPPYLDLDPEVIDWTWWLTKE